MKVAYAQNLGNPQTVIYGKNPDLNNTILETSQSVIYGKKIQNSKFPVIYDSFDFVQFLGIYQTVISGRKIQSVFLTSTETI